MKKLLALLFVFSTFTCYAQNNSDAIVGKWLKIPKEDMIIEVYKAADEYHGKISWTKNTDLKKPIGFIILDDLKFNPKKAAWEDGRIHVPDSGKSYDAVAKINADGTLELLGYPGVKFLGVTRFFKKIF